MPEIGATSTRDIDEKAIVRRLSVIGVGGNVLLTAFKLFAGIAGRSSAMVSDGIHSLSDVFATLIALVGVKISKRPADSGHPYGHERFECVASMVLGAILVATAVGIGYAGIMRVVDGSYVNVEPPAMIALIAAIVSIAVKEGMFWYTRHYARIMKSSAFEADAWHHRSDAISSVGALIGIGLSMAGFPIADPIASVVICAIILKAAFDIMKGAVDQMVDVPCPPEFEEAVRKALASEPGVERVDSLHTRQFGNRAYVDAEIAIDGEMRLREAHAIAEKAHSRVELEFPEVKHIMIHVNPDGE